MQYWFRNVKYMFQMRETSLHSARCFISANWLNSRWTTGNLFPKDKAMIGESKMEALPSHECEEAV